MRDFICAANWKLNKTPREAQRYCETLLKDDFVKDHLIQGNQRDIANGLKCAIFPPAYNWNVVSSTLDKTQIHWGPQNCYAEKSGAFTGENSAHVAKEMGASYVLVGHSERRQLFLENNDSISDKIEAFQGVNLIPILCVGETLQQRQSGQANHVVGEQLRCGLAKVDFSKKFVVAYEPVWAIGTGEVASLEQVEEAHKGIGQILLEIASDRGGNGAPENFRGTVSILYGGSVKPDNAKALGELINVDGFLVGGASLEPESFLSILKSSK